MANGKPSAGKITKRTWTTKSGKINYSWKYEYRDENGEKQRLGGFAKQSDALEAMEKAKHKKPIPENIRDIFFNEIAERYIKEHCVLYCKQSTIKSYESCLNKNIYSFFRNKKIVDIKTADITSFILELKKPQKVKRIEKRKTETGKTIKLEKYIDKEPSSKTINNNIILVTSILNFALNMDIIENNPCEKVKKLKVPYKEMLFWDKEEIFKILDTAKTFYPNFYPAVFTSIFAGIRQGELIGLTWDKVDLKNKTIKIEESMFDGNMQDPKTLASIRTIDLVDELVEALRTHKKNRNKLTKHVFHNSVGKPLDPDNMVKRDFKNLIIKAEVKRIRWHDLRHTFASLLISQNLPIKYIQRQMGHASIDTTLNRYGHLMPDVNDKAMVALNGLFSEGHNLDTISQK